MNPSIKSLLRKHVADAPLYISAAMQGGKDKGLVYLNANENPYELPYLGGLNRYPSPQPPELLRAMADLYGVEPQHVMASRGADEAIQILTRLLCEPHKDAIVTHPPTFGMYSVDAGLMPAQVIDAPLIDGFSLDVDGIISAGKRAKIVYICSPNNPTGTSFPHDEICGIARALDGHALVVVDEAYAEFSSQGSIVQRLKDHANMAVLRTLSKAYSLTGARVGALICNDGDFITLCQDKGLDAYSLPKPSIDAAIKAIEQNDIAQENIRKILIERDDFIKEIKDLPAVLKVYDTDANFVLLKIKNARGFWQNCYDNGIVLRHFPNDKALLEHVRISIGTHDQMCEVAKFLSTWR